MIHTERASGWLYVVTTSWNDHGGSCMPFSAWHCCSGI